MIDDVFDVPEVRRLNPRRYREFREAYNSDGQLRRSIAHVAGREAPRLPAFGELDEEDIGVVWRATWKPRFGGRRLRKEYRLLTENLFGEHGDDVLSMLQDVEQLWELFATMTTGNVSVYGTDFDPGEAAKADIVVVDYFLGHRLEAEEAFAKVLDAINLVRRHAHERRHNSGRRLPSFLLVSSRMEEVDIPRFRQQAKLMNSRFRAFSKEMLNVADLDNMLSLHDLIDSSDRIEVVERLIEDWHRGASEAKDLVRDRMLELDVSDLVYLDWFRLAPEGTSVGSYLRWFMNAYFGAQITRALKREVWSDAEGVQLFSVVKETGEIDENTLAKSFEGPSTVIARAYGDILFDESRGLDERAFPSALKATDLLEGDLFVKRGRGRRGDGLEGAEVRMVVTPSCDLIVRPGELAPDAKCVVLLSGELKEVRTENRRTKDIRMDLVRLEDEGEERLYEVRWNFDHTVSVGWGELNDSGVGEGFDRLGRVRDLYFHRVRDEWVRHLSRIGTEVMPLFPTAVAGEVWIAVQRGGKKNHERMINFSVDACFLWEMGPVRLTKADGKKEMVHVYQGTRKLVKKMMSALEKFAVEDEGRRTSANAAREHLRNMGTCNAILKPRRLGIRGLNGAIEFRKMPKKANTKVKSNADILILASVD